MPPDDPVLLMIAWVLGFVSLVSAIEGVRSRGAAQREAGEPYAVWQRFKDAAIPLGFGLYALRLLMVGYGYLLPDGGGSRFLLALTALLVLGGIAATRIRRMPM